MSWANCLKNIVYNSKKNTFISRKLYNCDYYWWVFREICRRQKVSDPCGWPWIGRFVHSLTIHTFCLKLKVGPLFLGLLFFSQGRKRFSNWLFSPKRLTLLQMLKRWENPSKINEGSLPGWPDKSQTIFSNLDVKWIRAIENEYQFVGLGRVTTK